MDGYLFSDCDRLLEILKGNKILTIIDLDGYQDNRIELEKLSSFDSIILNKSLLKQLTGSASLKEKKTIFTPYFQEKLFVHAEKMVLKRCTMATLRKFPHLKSK